MKHKAPKKRVKKSQTYALNNFMSEIWQTKLRETLKKRRLSQRALAEKAGMGSTSIRHMVSKAHTVTLESLKRISDAVDLPLSYFVTGNTYLTLDMGVGEDDVIHKIFVLPIFGPRDNPPGENHGKGWVSVPEKDAGVAPYAFQSGDNSMAGEGANYPVSYLQCIGPQDVCVFDAQLAPTPGQTILANLGTPKEPIWAARVYEEDGDEMFASALSRSFGRKCIQADEIFGTLATVVRRA